MRHALIGLLILMSTGASAQELVIPEVSYPSLPKEGASAETFVPQGWKLETQKTGDLDKDGKDDLLLLLRMDDARNVLKHEGLGQNPFDTNPRILAVAFAGGTGKPYRLGLENHTLIGRPVDPVLEDPLSELGGISIEREVLKVELHLFSSAGSWATGLTTYRFRHGKSGFELIGFDRSTTGRGDGTQQEVSINYLTGKVKISTGTIESDEEKVEWRKLKKKPLFKIEDIGNGLEFEPEY
jgi:hypothetical protein